MESNLAPVIEKTQSSVSLKNYKIHSKENRGIANHGWLSSYHSFSFGHYYNPQEMGFSDLLVINEDRVAPRRGFGMHGHKDMEIFSYVLEGVLEHQDSMGNGAQIEVGDVQLMSAGSGVQHSEFNPSAEKGVHFLQVWIKPKTAGGQARYEQKHFSEKTKRGNLRLIISPNGEQGALSINQNVKVYAGLLDGKEQAALKVDPMRSQYVHVAQGSVKVNDIELQAGDALKVFGGNQILHFTEGKGANVLVFDLNPL